jgi:hypothetical protein
MFVQIAKHLKAITIYHKIQVVIASQVKLIQTLQLIIHQLSMMHVIAQRHLLITVKEKSLLVKLVMIDRVHWLTINGNVVHFHALE